MDKVEVIINGEKHLLIEEINSDSVQCYNCSLRHLCDTGSENITALCVLLTRNLNCRFIPKEEIPINEQKLKVNIRNKVLEAGNK